MLNKPKIFEPPESVSSLKGGEMACSGNTCSKGYTCSSVDSSGGGCSYALGVGAIAAGVGVGATVGVALT